MEQQRIDTGRVRRAAEDVVPYGAQGAWWALLGLDLSAGAAVGGAATTARG